MEKVKASEAVRLDGSAADPPFQPRSGCGVGDRDGDVVVYDAWKNRLPCRPAPGWNHSLDEGNDSAADVGAFAEKQPKSTAR